MIVKSSFIHALFLLNLNSEGFKNILLKSRRVCNLRSSSSPCIMTRFVILLFWLLLSIYGYGHSLSSIAGPHLQSYTQSQYKAGNQNWSIDQDEQGVIYTANSEGILTYDGSYWEIYPLKNKAGARSVRIAGEKIYAGGKEEFGYFEKENGR